MKNLLLITFLVLKLLIGSDLSAQNNLIFPKETIAPRMRIIIDNDFGGDPDGLFQLTHHLLSPSVEIRGIIGSYIKGFFDYSLTSTSACNTVNELLKTMNLNGKYPVFEGANTGLIDSKTPNISEGAKAIVKEALREDTKLPLYVVCGAGLTDIASAYLLEPKIAKRLTLIWIGGPEYSDLALPPPGYSSLEYNLCIDIIAAQVIYNISDITLWQIPRDAYRQAILPYSELIYKIRDKGDIGKYLVEKVESVMKTTQKYNFSIGETYIVGDSPLVLLTALQSSFEADASSSKYVLKPAPKINDSGLYEVNLTARNIRVYTNLDIRLMLEDFFVKLAFYNEKR
jgi:inosine-uridine nucleoside N-ribohydrolase